MKDKIDLIEFDESILPQILELFNKELDDEGKIIDKDLKEVEIDQYSHEEISKDNFGGVLVGSKFFVTKNSGSFAEHISMFCKK